MEFKDAHLEKQLRSCSLILQLLVEDFCQLSEKFLSVIPVVTRVYDPIDGETGVHNNKRAVDLRDQIPGGFLYSIEQTNILMKLINQKWKRNDGQVTCLHHSFKGGPFHFHLQIPVSSKVYEN